MIEIIFENVNVVLNLELHDSQQSNDDEEKDLNRNLMDFLCRKDSVAALLYDIAHETWEELDEDGANAWFEEHEGELVALCDRKLNCMIAYEEGNRVDTDRYSYLTGTILFYDVRHDGFSPMSPDRKETLIAEVQMRSSQSIEPMESHRKFFLC